MDHATYTCDRLYYKTAIVAWPLEPQRYLSLTHYIPPNADMSRLYRNYESESVEATHFSQIGGSFEVLSTSTGGHDTTDLPSWYSSWLQGDLDLDISGVDVATINEWLADIPVQLDGYDNGVSN